MPNTYNFQTSLSCLLLLNFCNTRWCTMPKCKNSIALTNSENGDNGSDARLRIQNRQKNHSGGNKKTGILGWKTLYKTQNKHVRMKHHGKVSSQSDALLRKHNRNIKLKLPRTEHNNQSTWDRAEEENGPYFNWTSKLRQASRIKIQKRSWSASKAGQTAGAAHQNMWKDSRVRLSCCSRPFTSGSTRF